MEAVVGNVARPPGVFDTGNCYYTYLLAGGSIAANGPVFFSIDINVLPTVLAVTGGTGHYKGAAGQVRTCFFCSSGPPILWEYS